MELLNSFLGQGMIAQIGEIVLFANTVTMAMPTRWRGNMMMDYLSRILNYLAMNMAGVEVKPLKKVNKPYKIRREGSFVNGFR